MNELKLHLAGLEERFAAEQRRSIELDQELLRLKQSPVVELKYIIRDGWLEAFEHTLPGDELDPDLKLWSSTIKGAGRRDTFDQARGSFGVFELGSTIRVADCSTRYRNLSSKVRLAKWVRTLKNPPFNLCPQPSGWLKWDFDFTSRPEGSEFLVDVEQNANWYVLKKDGASGGTGVYFCNSLAEIQRQVLLGIDMEEALPFLDERRDSIADWAVQRHIDHPLLLTGHKFHLRAFVVHVGNRVFFYRTFEVRIAPVVWESLDTSTRSADQLKTSHITNGGGSEALHERRFLASAFPELNELCAHDIPAFLTFVLQHSIQEETTEDVDVKVWTPASIMGLDIMVDASFQLHLLEANHSPASPPTDEVTEFGRHVRQLCKRIVALIVAAEAGSSCLPPNFVEVSL